jgi:hypothetical protein
MSTVLNSRSFPDQSRTLNDSRLRSVLVELSDTFNEREKAVRILHQGGFRLVSSRDIQIAGAHECAIIYFANRLNPVATAVAISEFRCHLDPASAECRYQK